METNHSPTPNDHPDLNTEEDSPAEKLNKVMDEERLKMRDAITNLSKMATLTVAETYEVEDMGVVFAPGFQEQVKDERNRLNQSLGDLARQREELNATINEVQRATGSLQYMIDPETTDPANPPPDFIEQQSKTWRSTMVILNRNISIEDNRELVVDVTAQEIADKGLAFTEAFWQVHRAYARSRQGEESRITDREILNFVNNLLWEKDIRTIGARALSLHELRQSD